MEQFLLLQILVLASVESKVSNTEIAWGIKTCHYYHDTRVRGVESTWGKRAPFRIYGSDEMPKNESLAKYFTALSDRVEGDKDDTPYIPPWREEHDPSSKRKEPLLTEKMYHLLRTIYDKFSHHGIKWFIITDDDTYVRVDKMKKLLAKYDHTKPHLFGSPIPSWNWLKQQNYNIWNGQTPLHCGGGSGLIMSKATIDLILPHFQTCLQRKYTKKWWYSDEIELSNCIWEFAKVKCTGIEISDESWTGAPPDDDRFLRLFLGGLKYAKHWKKYERWVRKRVKNKWKGVETVTFHGADKDKMAQLEKRFYWRKRKNKAERTEL